VTGRLIAVALAALASALSVTAADAATAPLRAGGHAKVFAGIVPDGTGLVRAALRPVVRAVSQPVARAAGQPVAHAANVSYGGGPVLHWNRTHVIFWQPSGSGLSYDSGYESLIDTFFADVAADSRKTTNTYSLTGQYGDSGGPAAYNSRFSGSVTATDPLPSNGCVEPLGPPLGDGPGWTRCLTDQQLENELESVVHADHLPATGNDIYFLVLPDGLGSCEFSGPDYCALGGSTGGSFCGYHSSTADGLLYAVIPYNALSGHCQSENPRPNASTADPAISTLSHEQIETVTDPTDMSWYSSSSGEEIADLCLSEFGPSLGGSGHAAWDESIHGGHFYLQEVWSNATGSCQPRAGPDKVSFTVSPRPAAHAPVVFAGRASDPHGTIVAYNWFFGDHGTGRSRRATHTFKRSGADRVVLRVTDSSGNWAFDAITVHVKPAPSRSSQAR
jgi:hypothetical protein